MPILSPTETLERHIDQNGIPPGARKLAQFQQALRLRGTPPLYSQDGQGDARLLADDCLEIPTRERQADSGFDADDLCHPGSAVEHGEPALD